MRVIVDDQANILSVEDASGSRRLDLYSDAGFEVLSQLVVTVGWSRRYSYGFTWMGRPIIQLPDDIVRIQEVIWQVKAAR
jgi:cephalosporin hydroxylase